jgi:hypothetical protein
VLAGDGIGLLAQTRLFVVDAGQLEDDTFYPEISTGGIRKSDGKYLVCGSAKREETCIRGCRRTNGLAVGRVRSEKDAWLEGGLWLVLEPTEENITELNEDCGDECPLPGEDGVVV